MHLISFYYRIRPGNVASAILCLLSLNTVSIATEPESGQTVTNASENSYSVHTFEAFGYRIGEIFTLDEELTEEEMDAVLRGIRRHQKKSGPPPDFDEEQANLQRLMAERQQLAQKRVKVIKDNLNQENRVKGDAFLEELEASGTVKKSDTGLYYHIVKKGMGKSPKGSDEVRLHLRATRISGQVISDSHQGKEPISTAFRSFRPGLQEALQLLQEGGEATFYVPPDLAYGDEGQGHIQPGETLVIEIELLEVIPQGPPPPMPENVVREIKEKSD
jgi:FKBP-type peptidyl-prolyl cis-trans isomerase